MVYLSPEEAEQWESVKKIWAQHGARILWIITVLLILSIGTITWQQYREKKHHEAQEYYQQWMQALEKKEEAQASAAAQILAEQYIRTPYGPFGQLYLIAQEVHTQRFAEAIAALDKLSHNSNHAMMRELVMNRLARLLMQDQQYTGALLILDSLKAQAFALNFMELKGDIYMQQKAFDKAREWYQKAITQMYAEGSRRPLLIIKSQSLGVSV